MCDRSVVLSDKPASRINRGEQKLSDGVRVRRWPWIVASVCLGVIAVSATAWALVTVMRPAEDPLASSEHVYVEVVDGEVGSSATLNTVAEWTQAPVAVNQAAGIVTSVDVAPGASVATGSTLYTVGLRPVVVAEGAVPMFREISAGMEGADVRQLQQMLGELGYYQAGVDGKVEAETTAAITRWQKTLGVEETGSVGLGDIVFVPSLPMRVTLDADIVHRGASLAGGEDGILGLSVSPSFWIPTTEAQAEMLTPGTAVQVTSPNGEEWPGVAGEQVRDPEDGQITVAVLSSDGGALCGAGCEQIGAAGQTTLSSQIVTVATVEGPIVPSSALITTADGRTAVIDDSGRRVPVEIVASAKGMSVVSGVSAGVRVQVPATQSASD